MDGRKRQAAILKEFKRFIDMHVAVFLTCNGAPHLPNDPAKDSNTVLEMVENFEYDLISARRQARKDLQCGLDLYGDKPEESTAEIKPPGKHT